MARTALTESTRVMSCDAHVVVDGPGETSSGIAARAVARLHELEARWSRFVDDSEISRLNRAGGCPTTVQTDTFRLVEHLVQAWHATDGDFDPTLLGTLVELGYSTSRDDADRCTSMAPDTSGRGRPDGVLVDRATTTVQLPRGTVLDPGGLGKGLAADIVAAEAAAEGANGVLVEIGGDLAVAGRPPDGAAWVVAIADPFDGDDAAVVRLAAGGVATSSSRIRTWGADRHHLIDPTTMAPSDRGVVACTVAAGTAAWAEAFTKVAFVSGVSGALDRYRELGIAARITTDDGRHHHTPAWSDLA